MSAHTPGPWTAHVENRSRASQRDGGAEFIPITAGGLAIARAWESQLLQHAEPNARLIAAAPELLAVLDRIIAAWDTGSDPDFTEFDIALREARRVSAAAHGRGIGVVLAEERR